MVPSLLEVWFWKIEKGQKLAEISKMKKDRDKVEKEILYMYVVQAKQFCSFPDNAVW